MKLPPTFPIAAASMGINYKLEPCLCTLGVLCVRASHASCHESRHDGRRLPTYRGSLLHVYLRPMGGRAQGFKISVISTNPLREHHRKRIYKIDRAGPILLRAHQQTRGRPSTSTALQAALSHALTRHDMTCLPESLSITKRPVAPPAHAASFSVHHLHIDDSTVAAA